MKSSWGCGLTIWDYVVDRDESAVFSVGIR